MLTQVVFDSRERRPMMVQATNKCWNVAGRDRPCAISGFQFTLWPYRWQVTHSTFGAGHGQGSPHWADPAGAGVQDGYSAQRGGPPPAARQQQAHAGAPCHQAGALPSHWTCMDCTAIYALAGYACLATSASQTCCQRTCDKAFYKALDSDASHLPDVLEVCSFTL